MAGGRAGRAPRCVVGLREEEEDGKFSSELFARGRAI